MYLPASLHLAQTTRYQVTDAGIDDRESKVITPVSRQADNTVGLARSSQNRHHNFEPCESLTEVATATIDEKLLFWWEGQPKLCRKIRHLKGNVTQIQDPGRPVLLNLLLNCTHLTHQGGLGTGNWLVGIYMARLAAAFASVHLNFRCTSSSYETEILPFLQGCYPPSTKQWTSYNASEKLLCDWDMKHAPIHLAALEIRRDMRKLVQVVTGVERPLLSIPVNTTMFGEVIFDEVAIHFRCGDVLRQKTPRGDYGFTRYSEYKRRISPRAKSIGIITQPFEKSRNRENDQDFTDECRDIVLLLTNQFRKDFPKAIVSVRNGPTETLTLSYVRLAVAEQTIIGLSSFGAFPILANFGSNYFEEGRLLVNKWLNFAPEIMNNMFPMKDGHFLRNLHIMKKGIQFTKNWIMG